MREFIDCVLVVSKNFLELVMSFVIGSLLMRLICCWCTMVLYLIFGLLCWLVVGIIGMYSSVVGCWILLG